MYRCIPAGKSPICTGQVGQRKKPASAYCLYVSDAMPLGSNDGTGSMAASPASRRNNSTMQVHPARRLSVEHLRETNSNCVLTTYQILIYLVSAYLCLYHTARCTVWSTVQSLNLQAPKVAPSPTLRPALTPAEQLLLRVRRLKCVSHTSW